MQRRIRAEELRQPAGENLGEVRVLSREIYVPSPGNTSRAATAAVVAASLVLREPANSMTDSSRKWWKVIGRRGLRETGVGSKEIHA